MFSESQRRVAKDRAVRRFPGGNENVRLLGRRFVAAGGRVRRVFGADTSAARVGGPERQRRPEERGSVRTGETGRGHGRQQLHDQTVRGESAIPGQRSVKRFFGQTTLTPAPASLNSYGLAG